MNSPNCVARVAITIAECRDAVVVVVVAGCQKRILMRVRRLD